MHMIKKLQRKFVMITMISLLAVLLLVVGGINGLNIFRSRGNPIFFWKCWLKMEGDFRNNGTRETIRPG